MALEKANHPIRFWKRIGILVLGLTANTAMAVGYNFVVYPYLIAVYGLALGWLYAVAGSIALCLGCLWFYDLTGQDWLGIETIKLVRDGEATGKVRKFFQRIADRGDAMAFLFLCIKYDAFIAVVYMRRGSENHTMTPRDWKIFWGAIVISNLYWGALVFGAIEVFRRWLMPYVSPVLNWLGYDLVVKLF